MKKAIIFAGGSISGSENFESLDYDIICVDKGIDYAISRGLKIKIAIGDFDSANEKSIQFIKDKNIEVLKFNTEKDMTDLELALVYCKKNLYKEIYVFGAMGSRMDHTLTNVFLLKNYGSDEINIRLLDKNNQIFFVNKNYTITNDGNYKYISLLPTNTSCKLNLYGTKWELENHDMIYGSSLTVSNEFINDAILEILRGDVYVVLSKD